MPGRRWRVLAPLAVAAAVIAVAVGAVAGLFHVVGGIQDRDVTSGSPARRAVGAVPSTSASAAPGISPTAAPGGPSAYRVAGSVTMKPLYLDCITESVCYAWFTQLAGSGFAKPSERTSDGE